VPSVFELSEPYRNHLISVLPRGRGVCAVCWTAVDPAYDVCYQCYAARGAFQRRRLADVVVPIALAVKREQLAHELWHYKYDADATVRARLEVKLAAVLWRFLGLHEVHVAEAAGVSQFDFVTTVPGTKQRDGEHPLARLVGRVIGQTEARYEQLLELGPSGTNDSRAVLVDRYRPTRTLTERPSLLLIDDTWTTGGRAQSAVLALRDAGAARVGVVVIGRHFDRAFGPGEAYYQRARKLTFTWERCCLELPPTDTPPS
jgi:predicted amidophosphoribosyltransferase